MPEGSARKSPQTSKSYVYPNVEFEIRSEEPAPDRRARLKREADDAAHQRSMEKAKQDHEHWKDKGMFFMSMIIVFMAALVSFLSLLFIPASSTWAVPLLTSIVVGMVGYLTGKAQAQKTTS